MNPHIKAVIVYSSGAAFWTVVAGASPYPHGLLFCVAVYFALVGVNLAQYKEFGL